MRVDEIVDLADYWEQYPEKRPDLSSSDRRRWTGDNFYEPLGRGVFRAHPGVHNVAQVTPQNLERMYVEPRAKRRRL